MFHFETVRNLYLELSRCERDGHVKDAPTIITNEVAMFFHVWTEPSGATIEVHQADETGFYQGIQAVVNRSDGNIGDFLFSPNKDLFGCGVVAVSDQDVIHVLSVWCKPKAAMGQALVNAVFRKPG